MVAAGLQTAAEVERSRQGETPDPPLTIGKTVPRILQQLATTARTIAVVGDTVVMVRGAVDLVVAGAGSMEGGVGGPVVVVEDRVICGLPRSPDTNTIFIDNDLCCTSLRLSARVL